MFAYERGAAQVTRRKTSRRREQAQPAYGMSMRPGLEATLVRGEVYTALSLPPSTYDHRTTFFVSPCCFGPLLSFSFVIVYKYVKQN